MIPASRDDLKNYCLRRLGAPVININVDDDQLDDRIDDALQLYKMYHYDGTEKLLIPHQITEQDISYQYIPIDPMIEKVVRIMPQTTSGGVANMFSFDYQFRLNDMRSLTSMPLVNYVITREYLQLMENIFVGELSFHYNKNTQRLFIDAQWGTQLLIGQWLVVECYVMVDPAANSNVYNDSWIKEYTTQQFKKQWSMNMKKFGGLVLPGGLTLNGQTMYDEADKEIQLLEAKLRSTYEEPPMFIVG